MGVNISRNLNAELHEGASDGAIKKERPDVTVDAYDHTVEAHAMLHDATWDEGDGSHLIMENNAGVVRGA